MRGEEPMLSNDMYYSEEGVYLNSKGEVVYGKDPDRKVQIVAPGGSVSMAVAKRYGLVVQPAPVQPTTPVKVEETVEEKAVALPPQNKAKAGSTANKAKK